MSRICLLHIGTTKTGTTTIQHSLDSNRKVLKAAGYEMLPNKLRQGNSDYLLALSQSKNKSNQETQDIYSKFFTKNKSNIIITSEQFSVIGATDRDFFKKTFNFLFSFNFKVNVILFVRNQKEWILSDYIQNVKGGGIYSLEKYSFASFITFGDNSIVPTMVGITIRAYALSTKLIAMSIEATEATIIMET